MTWSLVRTSPRAASITTPEPLGSRGARRVDYSAGLPNGLTATLPEIIERSSRNPDWSDRDDRRQDPFAMRLRKLADKSLRLRLPPGTSPEQSATIGHQEIEIKKDRSADMIGQ